MENWIKNVRIKNFKSIRDVSLDDCGRINLFIGKPNVGKSNLLEALSLFGPTYLHSGSSGFGKQLLRYEQVADLFFDQNFLEEIIEIWVDDSKSVTISNRLGQFIYEIIIKGIGSGSTTFTADGSINNSGISSSPAFNVVKKYQFPENQVFNNSLQALFLNPPFGENLLTILQTNKTLRKEASSMFEAYGLELLVDAQSQRLEIAKRRDGILFKTPFSLVADTLRRYLFHLAAIESNRDSVLLFEEPESHNYPPYIQLLAQRIIEEKTNQYFITTHSPFLFNTLVEGAKNVAVFVVDYDNFQTKVRRLTDENLQRNPGLWTEYLYGAGIICVMEKQWEIIPEDGAMRALVLTLGFRKPNTGQGIGDTLNKIEKQFKNRFAIGIVDDDKRKPKLFDLYENVLQEQDDLRLLQKPNSRHFLVVVEPAIELWLLNNAEKIELDSPFQTLKELQRVTKNELEVLKNQQFKQFLNSLNQASAPGFDTMAKWIEALREKYI